MVPMSEINEARRKAVEALDASRLAEIHYSHKAPYEAETVGPLPVLKASRLMVSVDTLAKAKAAIEAGADGILFGGESYSHRVITLQDYQAVWELARQADVRIDFNLPRIIKENHQSAIEKLLTALREGVCTGCGPCT
jgi:putative protease